ncbi:longitudinals lacking protein, isoforms A/B/D/L-like [Anopheles maculipalpis]|uniref:longitudinals lacking protein, isoforms A/B/D/L-like n=1 Tax=Anopheles maculipalpis TaxID=1496333 RepID=UPI002158B7F4|nr:longitudinals lacking protein, isoforms A/B/D/L-like [Anopheles maculipalpis]
MSATAGLSQQFCVRWNSHLGSLGAAFPQLLAGQRFVDVTLACEGHQVHCHRLVLAACSTYFENLLGENPCKHPIIILPRDIKLWAIQALVDFMYKGEVNVSQAGLPDLMKCAEILKIRGLCGSDAALNLNQLHSPTGGGNYAQQRHHSASSDAGDHPADNTNRTADGSSFPTRHGGGNQFQNSRSQNSSAPSGPKRQLLNSLNLQPIDAGSHQHQTDDGSHSDNGESGNEMCIKTEDLIIDDDDTSSRQCGDDDLGMDSTDKAASDAIRCERFLGVHAMDAEDRVNDHRVASDSRRDRMEEEMEEGETMIGDRKMTMMMMMMEKSDQSGNHTDRQGFVQDDCDNFAHENEGQDNDDDDEDDDVDNELMELGEETEDMLVKEKDAKGQEMRRKAKKVRSTVHHSTKSNDLVATHEKSSSIRTLSATSVTALSCSNSANKTAESNTVTVEMGEEGTLRANGTTRSVGTVPSLSSISTMRPTGGGSSRGSIRVKSIENLFENYQTKHQTSPKSSRDAKRKNVPQSSVLVLGCSGGASVSENDSASDHASSLLYNRNEMDIYVKQQQQQKISKATERHSSNVECGGAGDETTNASATSDGDGYENIICSPNFPQLSEVVGGYKAEEDDEEEEYGDEYAIQLLAEEIDSSMLANGGESEGDEFLYKPPPLMAIAGGAKGSHSGNSCANSKSSTLRTYGRMGTMGGAAGTTSTLTIRKLERDSRTNLNVSQARNVNRRSKLTGRSKEALHQLLNTNGAPPPIAFTLRNPRGNQPRTYNTEALWAALMDVKAGESIYRASQMHKVPRKTLRNWMKRWDIKSAYPMPRQLKEAAEKKRIIKELTSQIQ